METSRERNIKRPEMVEQGECQREASKPSTFNLMTTHLLILEGGGMLIEVPISLA